MYKFNPVKYGELLADTLPAVIESKADYNRQEEIFNRLFDKSRSPEEEKLFDLLAGLLEEYEHRTLEPVPAAAPGDVLKILMKGNELRQNDLADIFGTQSVVSDVLRGKREITKNQAKLLSQKFKVKVEAFL